MNRQQKQQQLNEQQTKYYKLLIKTSDKKQVDFILETTNEDCKHKKCQGIQTNIIYITF